MVAELGADLLRAGARRAAGLLLLAGDPLCDRRRGAGQSARRSRSRGSTRSPRWRSGTTSSPSTTAQSAVEGAARVVGSGRAGLVAAVRALAGALVIGAAVWLAIVGAAGGRCDAALGARGPVRDADPGRHADRLHALDGRDRRDGASRDPRPRVLPVREPQTPFSTTQFTMGLSGGLELLTILHVPDRRRGDERQRDVNPPDRLRGLADRPRPGGDGLRLPGAPRRWSPGSRAPPRRTRRS